jgi:hypothetical protein
MTYIEEMEKLKPDYEYYARLSKLTIPEFSLVIHRIKPELYSPLALDRALMFFRSENGLLLPDIYVPKLLFQQTLEKAYKTYHILDRVEWNKKYGGDYSSIRTIPLPWLVAEAQELQLDIPQEFLNHINYCHSPKRSNNKKSRKNTDNRHSAPEFLILSFPPALSIFEADPCERESITTLEHY